MAEQPSRLTPVDRSRELLPWRRATQLTDCFLYWLPVQSFPAPAAQKQWLLVFLERFGEGIVKKLGLRSEVFLQMKTLYPHLMDPFTLYCQDAVPLVGLIRRPGAPIPKAPSPEELQDIIDGKKKYEFNEYMPDLAYWFVKKALQQQLQLFLGHGGMTIVSLPPDPQTVPPKLMISKKMRQHPVFQALDVDALHEQTFAMTDGFQDKSKKLFGAGLETHPTYKGLRFILPLLETKDFFQQPKQERAKWFELFQIYFAESPADKGMLLALQSDVEEDLIELLKQMRDEDLRYPER
jgi:hypothetical protein